MESLELPLDMLWASSATKREPVSPTGASKCFINADPFLGNAADELWPFEEDNLLSYFAIEDDLLANSPTTTLGQEEEKNKRKKDDGKDQKISAQELLSDLTELKEEEQWMNQENVDLSVLTAQDGGISTIYGQSPTVNIIGGAPFSQLSQHQLMGSLYPEAMTLSAPVTPSVSPGLVLGTGTGCDNYVNSATATTELLFDEIKTFCNNFEAATSYQHHQQLTPPQSPPPTSPLFGGNAAAYEMQQMYPKQSPDQKPILNNYSVDAPTLNSATAAASAPFQHEARSFVDLQLQSSDCLDKTFVFSGDESQGEATSPVQSTPGALSEDTDENAEALAFIEEYLRNKTTEVHENYVLVGNTSCDESSSTIVQDRSAAKKLKGSNDAAVRAIAAIQQMATTDDVDIMMEYSDDSATQFSTPSYGNSLASSPSRSGTPQMLDSQDEDWSPEDEHSQPKRKAKLKGSGATSSSSIKSIGSAKRRPYERGCGEVEKKYRKKEQNKNAATRYRQKKKQEVETILEEETRLKKTNKKLASQFNDAKREMKYLRNLLRDMYKQNNIII